MVEATEKIASARKVPTYQSHFDEFYSQVHLEKRRGTGESALINLREMLETKNGSIYERIIMVHELEKLVINWKIKATESNNIKMGGLGVEAIRLCLGLAEPVYYGHHGRAIGKLNRFEKFIRTTPVSQILGKSFIEVSDPGITPEASGTEDLSVAKRLLEDTKGSPILAFGIGFRGLRREYDSFLDYRYMSQTPDSFFWPLRFSANFGDRFPRISETERKLLFKEAEGKRIVVLCPNDRNLIPLRGVRRFYSRLILSKYYLSTIVFGTEKDPAKIIAVPISLAKTEKKHNI